MDVIFVLIVATMLVVGVLAAIGLLALLFFWLGSSKKRKARRQAVLQDSYLRMRTVVAELLARVNELDEHCKYVEDKSRVVPAKERLSVAASDLVTLSDTLPAIEQLLSEGRFNDAADLLSASCRVVDKVVRIISQAEPDLGLAPGEKGTGGGVTIKIPKSKKSAVKKNEQA